jgi:OFA family oxalate/formate antiporter-like MFS transporter
MERIKYRYVLLTLGCIVKIIISISQYSWFLFAYAINSEVGWDLQRLGLTFTVFVFSATLCQPFSGLVADLYGPRRVAFFSAISVGGGLVLSSFASTPLELTLFYGLGGMGMGALNGVSTATAVKWFPDKRGLATGIVEFGFGAGTAFTNPITQALLNGFGFRVTFLYLGSFMWLTLIPFSFLFKYPDDDWAVPTKPGVKTNPVKSANWKPQEMLRTYQWFMIYFAFAFTISVVLMFGAQMKMLAKEFHIPQAHLYALLFLFPLGNGISRIIAGATSDRIGREKTMFIFYTLLGLDLFVLSTFGNIPLVFVGAVFMATLLGGSPFVLVPSEIGDFFGPKYATTNYGITVTAKAWAGFISGWLCAFLVDSYSTYKVPLVILAVLCILSGVFSSPLALKKPRINRGA